MALVIHELVTNSTKYGSLSGSGVVHIDWSRNSKDDLVITWREIGGPPVAPPKRKGFGTTIVNRSVPYDLGGQAKIDYAVDGVQAEFSIPARHVSEPKSFKGPEIRIPRPGVSSQQPIDPSHFGQKTVMLVEDSLIIALDAEDILDRFGATVLTASTPEAAHGILDQQRVDYAILDINLGDQTSFGVADRLKELGIPFFFASGYGEQANLPIDHRSMTVVQKPIRHTTSPAALTNYILTIPDTGLVKALAPPDERVSECGTVRGD